MGLLDNLDDPKKLMLLQMGLGLLGGAPQGRKNFGADLAHAGQQGLLGYMQGREMQDRRAKEMEASEMRKLQMEQARQQNEQMRLQVGDQKALRDAYTQNVVPGMPTMQPTDYETPSGPQGPSSFNMPGYQQSLLAAGPAGFQEYLKLQQMNKPQLMEVRPGASVIDQRTQKPVYTAPADEWEQVGRDPKTQQFIQRNKRTGEIKAVGTMPQQVNVNTHMPPQERAVLKADSDRLDELSTAASASRRIAQTSAVINGLLRGKEGGQLVKIGTETAKYLGLQSDTIAANDLVESLNTQLATQIRAPGSGATSNLEFEAYKAAAPSLKNSEAGRALMTNVAQKFATRNAKIADHARNLIRQGKYSDEAIAEYDEKLGSVLGDDLLKKLRTVAPSMGNAQIFRFDANGNPL